MRKQTQFLAMDLSVEILQALSSVDEPLLSSEVFPNFSSTDIKSALDRLIARSMITYETIEKEEIVLEDEALGIEANGSHEARVFEALRGSVEGLTIQELENVVGDKNIVKIGQGKAFRSKWIAKGNQNRLIAAVSSG